MKTDNELIAEFMEVPNVFVDKIFGAYQAEDETGYIDWVDNGIRILNYHQDWRLLMPVVEKMDFGVWTIRPGFVEFKSYAGELRPERQFCFNTSTADWQHPNDEIPFVRLVYLIAVEGIKWYNSQPSKPEN